MISGKRIFITGGAGFIASRLTRELIDDNEVVVYDNFVRHSLSVSELGDDSRISVLKGDVLDFDKVFTGMQGSDIVIHAAAIAGIDTVIKDPVKTMRVNMLGTANALEAARLCKIRDRFVDFSTSEVFGPMAFRVTEEDSTVSGSVGEARWTYAVSKLAGEHLTLAYQKHYGLPALTIRPFNIYGPGQKGEGAIQVFVKRALRNEPIEVTGDGSQIRAWCFVDDFVEALLLSIASPNAVGQSINIGNARAVITILGLAQTVCRVLNSESQIVHVPSLSADISIRVPSVERAHELLGFRARVDLEEGIRRTAEWMIESNAV